MTRLASILGHTGPRKLDPVHGYSGGKGFGGITLAHNVERKEEVAEVLRLAEKAGGKIVKPAQDVFWGGHSGYFADLDGYYWEVAWAPMCSFDETGALVFK